MLTLKDKDPNENLDYPIRWGQWLTPGRTLVELDCTVTLEGSSEPGGLTDLTVAAVDVDANDVIVRLSGGTGGETYTLVSTVKDNASPQRVGVRRLSLYVRKK